MKKRVNVLILLSAIFALGACGGGGSKGYDGPIDEDPDSYVDVMIDKTEQGNILQCFDWTFKQIKDNLPYIANAGFKMVQTSPVQQPKEGGSTWWAFYQPLGFSIADNSPLGTKDELRALCQEADNYGVSVICDIVFNHLANAGSGPSGTVPSPTIEAYEPEIYALRNDATNPTFHHYTESSGDKSGQVTQQYVYGGGLPDLNTAHPLVQQRSLDLLKECIDVGVDGFRFDAAKHIETPDDPDHASNFWPNVLEVAKQYYKQQNNGKELFAYGEILGGPDGGRSIDLYTRYMKVTEDNYCSALNNANAMQNAEKAYDGKYGKGANNAAQLVTWTESHDTYVDASFHHNENRMARSWAVQCSRKDIISMFLARPNDGLTVGKIGSYQFEEEPIGVSNRFHNRFFGGEEYLSAKENIFVNERVKGEDIGAMVINFANVPEATEVKFSKITNAIYYDQLTGNSVEIRNGKATIEFDPTGVCVLTKTKENDHPRLSISKLDGTFVNPFTVNITASHTTSATYKINGGSPVSFTGSTTVNIGSETVNDKVTLEVIVSNAKFSITKTCTYQKVSIIPGYFNVVNINPDYFTSAYKIYLWSWGPGADGNWNQNYTVQDGVLLVNTSGLGGFIVALYEGSTVMNDPTEWSQNGFIKKLTGDITNFAEAYYDCQGM